VPTRFASLISNSEVSHGRKKYLSIHELDVKHIVGAHDIEADIPKNLPFRKWLFSWVFDTNIPGNYQLFLDKWISILIVVNLFVLLFEHVPAVFEPNETWFHNFDIFSVIIFTVEYLLRLYVAPEDPEFADKKNPRLAYIFSPFAVIDFLAVGPFYLQFLGIPLDLRALRFLRLLRILKLFRVIIPAYHDFKKPTKAEPCGKNPCPNFPWPAWWASARVIRCFYCFVRALVGCCRHYGVGAKR